MSTSPHSSFHDMVRQHALLSPMSLGAFLCLVANSSSYLLPFLNLISPPPPFFPRYAPSLDGLPSRPKI